MEAPTIELGGVSATLVRPRAIAAISLSRDQSALDRGGAGLIVSLSAAALSLCWPKDSKWPSRPRPRPWRPGVPLEDYGADIFDALVEAGVDFAHVMDVGGTAYRWALTSRLSAQDVESAGNASGGPEVP